MLIRIQHSPAPRVSFASSNCHATGSLPLVGFSERVCLVSLRTNPLALASNDRKLLSYEIDTFTREGMRLFVRVQALDGGLVVNEKNWLERTVKRLDGTSYLQIMEKSKLGCLNFCCVN